MAIKLYDTLSDKKKFLKPRSNKKIEIFVCGPTAYDYSHIGHARTYIAFDAFIKYLRSQGYNVRYVQNITDIDDKIIDRAKKLKQKPNQLAHTFEMEYYRDMETLGIDSVDKYARATDYIKQIIEQVKRLLKKGYAYETNDGIYYDISKFSDYGKLSNRTARQAEDAVSRIDESVKKRNKGDFALWKYSKPGEPSWPFGSSSRSSLRVKDGRPGWHIEDTAITEQEFGQQYDIHGGARDLMFPHHESEIAQMEAISGKEPLANYWMHTGFLTTNRKKMSKSLGNFITIHEFLLKHSKEILRFFVLSSHYRSPIDYSERAVQQVEAKVQRIVELFQKLEKIAKQTPLAERSSLRGTARNLTPNRREKQDLVLLQLLETAKKNYKKELGDDFNTPKALAVVFNFVREINTLLDKQKINTEDAMRTLQFLKEVNVVFEIIPVQAHVSIPKKLSELVQQREELRRSEKWSEADKIRVQVEKMGYTIKDTQNGPEIKKRPR